MDAVKSHLGNMVLGLHSLATYKWDAESNTFKLLSFLQCITDIVYTFCGAGSTSCRTFMRYKGASRTLKGETDAILQKITKPQKV